MDLHEDEQFQNFFGALAPEELQLLADSIEEDGCTDPVVWWRENGKKLVVDGYHRKLVCEQTGVKYATKELKATTRAEVLQWIYNRQKGRRNLNKQALAKYQSALYELLKKDQSGNLNRAGKLSKGQSGPSTKQAIKPPIYGNNATGENDQKTDESKKSTAEKVAEITGSSPRTVKRAVETQKAVDQLAKTLKDKWEAGDLEATVAQVKLLAEMPKAEQIAAAKEVSEGAKWEDVLTVPVKKQPPKKKKKGKNGSITDESRATQILMETKKNLSKVTRDVDRVAEMRGGQGRMHKSVIAVIDQLFEVLNQYALSNEQ